jgi:hypothetical protein
MLPVLIVLEEFVFSFKIIIFSLRRRKIFIAKEDLTIQKNGRKVKENYLNKLSLQDDNKEKIK